MVVHSKFMVIRHFLIKSTECGSEKGITFTRGVESAADSAACGGVFIV